MSDPIKVTYEYFTTAWSIEKNLKTLQNMQKMSFDIETAGLYPKEERKRAIKLLENNKGTEAYVNKLASVIANNSGLSFPTLTKTTHFILGLSNRHALIFLPPTPIEELKIWKWLKYFQGKLIIHNTLFDLRMMYNRIGALPLDYDDTALMLKTLINNSDVWRAKIGLKDQMGGYYSPFWALYDEYEPENLKNPKFLEYSAIDGAATYYLHDLILREAS